MRKVTAISVYNPQDPLEQAVADAYYDRTHKTLTAGQVKGLIESILAYDGLLEDFLKNPHSVCREIFADKGADLVCVPCYPLELRQILRKKIYLGSYKIAAFSPSLANKFLQEYPLLLVLDAKQLEQPVHKFGGIQIYSDSLALGESLVRVMTRDRGDLPEAHVVDEIVQEEAPNASVHVINDVPGISMKAAQVVLPGGLRTFVVNLPALGIENQHHKAESPEKALDICLNAKWKQSKNPHRDPVYTVPYWEQSPYYGNIVREAGMAAKITIGHNWLRQAKSTVVWICGIVGVESASFHSESDHRTAFLVTNKGKVKIRREDHTLMDDDTLLSMEGRQMCFKGMMEGQTFVVSQWSENEPELPENVEIMKRHQPQDLVNFEVGDKVRHRQRGLAFSQIIGEITRIDNNLMYVKWNGIKELEVFKLNDTVALHALLTKM